MEIGTEPIPDDIAAALTHLYEPAAVQAWLYGVNPLLGDRRPIDLIRDGRSAELLPVIRIERAESFA